MDVGAPNNWERISRLVHGRPEALRGTALGPLSDRKQPSCSGSCGTWVHHGSPRAVAFGVLRERLASPRPASSWAPPPQVRRQTGAHPQSEGALPPPSPRQARPLLSEELPNDFEALKAALAKKKRSSGI